MPDIVYLDVESTGTAHFHELWEVAYVKTDNGGNIIEEYSTMVKPENFSMADPFALRIGRYSERFPDSFPAKQWEHDRVWRALEGCDFAGITVSFDARMVGDWFLKNGLTPFPWNYRLLDVSTYAAGIAAATGLLPPREMPNSDKIFSTFGIEIPEEDRHTALGDARATMRLHHAALAVAAQAGPQVGEVREER